MTTKPSDPFSLAVREVFGEYVPQAKVEELRGRLARPSKPMLDAGVNVLCAADDAFSHNPDAAHYA